MRSGLLLVAFLLAGCALPQSLPPGTSEAEVRNAMGRPALELPNRDGSRQLAYPTGPFGLQTYMAHIAPDGRLIRVEQVLDDVRFHQIQPGMTREELLRFIGPPFQTAYFGNLGQTAWDYRFRDTWGYVAILSVMLDDNGIVVGRSTQRIERDRDRAGGRG
jgi:outer membrane protein assembly factor BamE (lipoprotein component of BamABCDE complex)